MQSLPNDAWDWLQRAEEARMAAERASDPETKATMLQFAHLYLQFAQTSAAIARAQLALLTLGDRPN